MDGTLVLLRLPTVSYSVGEDGADQGTHHHRRQQPDQKIVHDPGIANTMPTMVGSRSVAPLNRFPEQLDPATPGMTLDACSSRDARCRETVTHAAVCHGAGENLGSPGDVAG
jgi:hypothetical protein